MPRVGIAARRSVLRSAGRKEERRCNRLFTRAVEAEGIEFAVVNGFSREGAARFDLEPGRRYPGYDPEDDFETALASHLARVG